MTPEEKQLLCEQRADALRAFMMLWCVLVVIVGFLVGLMLLVGG